MAASTAASVRPRPSICSATICARRAAGSSAAASKAMQRGSKLEMRENGEALMDGLMMDFPLTLSHLFDRVGLYFGKTELVSRRPDKSIHRTTYGEFHRRAQKLANALQRLGLRPRDPSPTLPCNHPPIFRRISPFRSPGAFCTPPTPA